MHVACARASLERGRASRQPDLSLRSSMRASRQPDLSLRSSMRASHHRRAMVQGPNVGMVAAALGWLAPASGFAATIQPHAAVRGSEVSRVEVRAAGKTWRGAAWDDLDRARVDPGSYEIRFDADGGSLGAHVQLPHCAGRARITVDGRGVTAPAGPALVALPPGTHDIRITVSVSNYERRIACGDRPRVGEAASSVERSEE